MTRRYCMACDLKDDPVLIEEYKKFHEAGSVWTEITRSIKEAGIVNMEIYLLETRLFMIMETDESFSFEKKAEMDAGNPKVQEWEELMWKYQQELPWADKGVKWILMDRIFMLEA